MFRSTSTQIAEMLMARLSRLKQEEGLLLAVYPDFVLAARPRMNGTERNAAADALLESAEGLSLPVMEDHTENNDKIFLNGIRDRYKHFFTRFDYLIKSRYRYNAILL